MDPTANLRAQLALAKVDWTEVASDRLSPQDVQRLLDSHIRLCELVMALDGWVKSGGFLPIQWRRY
jgi:hypothetical protein